MSRVFGKMILFDMRYNEERNLDFLNTIFTNWDDFRPYLIQNNPGESPEGRVQIILIRLLDGLNELHKKFPAYLRGIQLDRPGGSFTEPHLPERLKPNRDQFRLFEKLMNSFPDYLALISDANAKQKSIEQFQSTICNQSLTQTQFGLSFDPKKDPEAFKDCGKTK